MTRHASLWYSGCMDILEITRDIQHTLEQSELCRQQAEQTQEIARRLESREVTIAVIGQFKRGKTSLVNRILGSRLLPVGIVPITSAVTRISYAATAANKDQTSAAADKDQTSAAAEKTPADTARVFFLNGLSEDVPAEDLHRYISEQENPDNERCVAEVELRTDAEFLKDGLTLVDTPGVGSVHENNSKSAYDFARESDGVIFMLSVDSPINQIEIDFLKDTRRFAGKFYFVVNKIDTIDEEDLAEYLEYCSRLLCTIMEAEPGSEAAGAIRLLPVSAKKNIGIDELKKMIREDLLQSAAEIMQQSAANKLLEILKDTRAQISSYREVLRMAPNVFRSRFDRMHAELARRSEAAEQLPRQFADGSPRQYLQAQLNDEKRDLTEHVRDLFGIEYTYRVDREEAGKLIDAEDYIAALQETYRQLAEAMDTIFMYKEENAYTVARRIEDLDILIHDLDRYRRVLSA